MNTLGKVRAGSIGLDPSRYCLIKCINGIGIQKCWHEMTEQARAPRKPDIVCIGAQKAGTSWLHEIAGSRRDIWIPPFKELHFFDHKFITENRRWTTWHVEKGVERALNRHKEKGGIPDQEYIDYLNKICEKPMFNGNWYKYVFSWAPSNSICLDVCPEYCEIPQEGINFVSSFLPDAKFIYLIRCPIERAISQLKMNISRNNKFNPSSIKDWEMEAASPVIEKRGDYINYIPNWNETFGKEKLLFLPFGKISQNPREILESFEFFLGIDSKPYTGVGRKVHASPKMDVPESIIEELRKKLQPQVNFLQNTFGKEFYLKTIGAKR